MKIPYPPRWLYPFAWLGQRVMYVAVFLCLWEHCHK